MLALPSAGLFRPQHYRNWALYVQPAILFLCICFLVVACQISGVFPRLVVPPHCCTRGFHRLNRANSGSDRCCPGLKPPHWGTRGRVCFFCPKTRLPLPLKGGADYRLSWVRRVCPTRLQPAHTAPTGPVWGHR